MYLDVSDVYPKMYLGLVWDTCKIHAKHQDTCILLECNRAFKIHFEIHQDTFKGYMYPSEYMQDTCKIHRNTSGYVSDRKPPPKRIGNPPAPRALALPPRIDRENRRGAAAPSPSAAMTTIQYRGRTAALAHMLVERRAFETLKAFEGNCLRGREP